MPALCANDKCNSFIPARNNKYCSADCKYDALRDRAEKVCDHCEEEFEVPASRADTARFCSQECYDAWRDEHKIEDYDTKWYHKKRRELIQRLGGCCVSCGATDELEFHHPNVNRSRREGGSQMLREVRDDLENGVVVELRCRPCHADVTPANEHDEPCGHVYHPKSEL